MKFYPVPLSLSLSLSLFAILMAVRCTSVHLGDEGSPNTSTLDSAFIKKLQDNKDVKSYLAVHRINKVEITNVSIFSFYSNGPFKKIDVKVTNDSLVSSKIQDNDTTYIYKRMSGSFYQRFKSIGTTTIPAGAFDFNSFYMEYRIDNVAPIDYTQLLFKSVALVGWQQAIDGGRVIPKSQIDQHPSALDLKMARTESNNVVEIYIDPTIIDGIPDGGLVRQCCSSSLPAARDACFELMRQDCPGGFTVDQSKSSNTTGTDGTSCVTVSYGCAG